MATRAPVSRKVSRAVVQLRRGIDVDADQFNHDAREGERQLSDVARPTSLEDFDGLADFEGVADSASEGSVHVRELGDRGHAVVGAQSNHRGCEFTDRKSTRLNSSHLGISYAVFCLK